MLELQRRCEAVTRRVRWVNWRNERRALLGVAGLMVSLAATACGVGSSAPTTTGTIVLTAATKTAGTGSFQLSGDYQSVETAHPSVVEDKGALTGKVDIAKGRSLVTSTDIPGLGVSSQSGESALPPGAVPPPPGAVPPLTTPTTTTTITIGRTLWISGGGGLLGQPQNSWLEVPLPTQPATTSELGMLGDPSQIFNQLRSHLTGVTLLGHQIVDGTPTAHYEGRDTWQIPKDISGSPAAIQVTVNVWVDQAGMVRQLEMAAQTPALSINKAPTLPAETSTTTMRFFDFGEPVNIQAPPPGQVITNPSTNLFGEGSSNQP
jgi:hypothetical protein